MRRFATEWLPFVNLKFDFSAKAPADIRITFEADPGSWSAIGTDALVAEYFTKDEPTMNFGWLKDDTEDNEWRRIVLHEFGHAIGGIHEHQNPRGGIRWNLPAVYEYFSGRPNYWTKEDIDFNVLQKYSIDQVNSSKFDPKSIMIYALPRELFVKGPKRMSENADLSPGDKAFVGKMYPKRSRLRRPTRSS